MFKYVPQLILFFEITAAFLALIHFKKYKYTKEKKFLFFLWIVVVIELIGSISNTYYKKTLVELFNIYIVLSFIFYFFWYHSILINLKHKNILKVLSGIYLIITIKELLTQNLDTYLSTTFIVGAIIVLILSFFYYSQLLKSNKVLHIKHNLRFWIATGLMLFNIGMVPFIFFSTQLYSYNEVYMGILGVLNFVLYFCYSIGFIWSKPTQ